MSRLYKRKFLFILILSVFCVSAYGQFALETVDMHHDSLPSGAIPFKDYRGAMIFDGIVNDSVHIKAHFDIGAWGIAAPTRLQNGSDSIKLQIGSYINNLKALYLEEGNTFLKWFGQECVTFGWDFFDKKVIVISYKENYICVLSEKEISSLNGYMRIPFRNKGKRLLVEAGVNIQGKNIEGSFWIDTGLNGLIFFTYDIPAKYSLNLDNTKKGRAKNMYNNQTQIDILHADTVRLGNSYLTDKDILIPKEEWFVFKPNDMYIGLIGNQFFHSFSTIFDFRNNCLYLKPFDN